MSPAFPCRAGTLCVLVLSLAFPAFSQSVFQPLPIKVHNGATVPRMQEPVTLGFPVPEATDLHDAAAFVVLDPLGQPVPAQFRCLTRWHGPRDEQNRALRWVQATFAASVPASSAVEYTIVTGTANPVGQLDVSQNPAHITVTTAPGTEFVISKNAFNLFHSARVGGQPILGGPGGIDFIRHPGLETVATGVVTDIEESGSVRAVVRQRGQLGDLRFTCRWFFHSGRADVEVRFRLENPHAYGLLSETVPDGERYFQNLALSLRVAGGNVTVTTPRVSLPLVGGTAYEQRQGFGTKSEPGDMLGGFWFFEKIGGAPVAAGHWSDGAIDVCSGNGRGVTVAVDRFWETFPKSLRVANGRLDVDLWPAWGDGPAYAGQFESPGTGHPDPLSLDWYRFEGGRWRTHRMVFDFHNGAPRTGAEVAAIAAKARAPLAGHASGLRIGLSNASGLIYLDQRASWPHASFDRYDRFFAMMCDDQAADPIPYYGNVGLNRFRARGGPFGGWQNYGWENWGDLTWAEGYCNLHYDWPGSLLLAFVRTADYRFFDQARDMVAFRRDYGQDHTDDPGEYWRGASFYEKGWWHGNSFPGAPSHNWVLGTMLHYVLTGDEASYEAAMENIAFVLRDPPEQWSGWWGSRIPGWAIDNLVDAHNLLGYPGALAAAGAGVARFEQLEIADGAHGYHLDPGNVPVSTSPWLDNIFFIAAARYVIASGDRSHDAFLHRMKTWFKQDCLTLPSGTLTQYTLPWVLRSWAPNAPGAPSIHLCWPMLEALSYSALLFNDADDLLAASLLFESVVRYWQQEPQGPPVDLTDPQTYSSVTMRPFEFPTSETKILGNIMMWGRVHLFARAYFEGWL